MNIIVETRLDLGLVIECQLIVVVDGGPLAIRRFDSTAFDKVDLERTEVGAEGRRHPPIGYLRLLLSRIRSISRIPD